MRSLSRREFLQISALATAGVAAAACAKTTAPTATPQPKVAATPTPQPKVEPTATPKPTEPPKSKESPILADLVKTGKLPAMAERLPTNPAVFFTNDGIGTHGGTMRRGFKGVSDRWGPTKLNDRALVWFDNTLKQVPRLAESWEVSDDATTWTFHLRKGIKWSDGEPFTSEAIKWRYEYDYLNADLSPSKTSGFASGKKKGSAAHGESVAVMTASDRAVSLNNSGSLSIAEKHKVIPVRKKVVAKHEESAEAYDTT